MTLTQEKKQELVEKFGESASDTGKAEVQIALLTAADQRPHRASARPTRRITTRGAGC